jgi:hypothetical protein
VTVCPAAPKTAPIYDYFSIDVLSNGSDESAFCSPHFLSTLDRDSTIPDITYELGTIPNDTLEKIITPVILGYEEIRTQHPNCFDLLTVSIDIEIDNRWQQVYYQKGASCKNDCEWTNGWISLVNNGDFSKLHLNISEQTLINEIWRLLNTEDINISLPMRYSLRDGNNNVI